MHAFSHSLINRFHPSVNQSIRSHTLSLSHLPSVERAGAGIERNKLSCSRIPEIELRHTQTQTHTAFRTSPPSSHHPQRSPHVTHAKTGGKIPPPPFSVTLGEILSTKRRANASLSGESVRATPLCHEARCGRGVPIELWRRAESPEPDLSSTKGKF